MYASSSPGASPGHRPVAPAVGQADRLRAFARQLERLNVTGRLDPEQIAGAKHAIVRGMDRLASELDR